MSDSFTREKYEEFTSLFPTAEAGHDMLMRTGQQMQTQTDLAKRLGVALKSADGTAVADGADADGAAEATGLGAQARAIVDALYSRMTAGADEADDELLVSKDADPQPVRVVGESAAADPVLPDSLTLDSSNLDDGVSPAFDGADSGFPLEEASATDDGESMSIDDFVAATTREAAKAASGAVAAQVSTQMTDVLTLMAALTDKVVAIHDETKAQAAANSTQLDAVKQAVSSLQAQYGELDQNMPAMATIDRLRTSSKSAGGSQAGDAGLAGGVQAGDATESFVNPLVADTFGFANSF